MFLSMITLNYLLLELLRQSNSLLFPEVVVLGTDICSTVLLHSYTLLTINQLHSFNVVEFLAELYITFLIRKLI